MGQHQNIRTFSIAVTILVCWLLQAEGADKYTDENRPYEFGFNVEIDGSKQQHRHEKKDKDGIIMGEFGFVTADDVYHVTVYATDKEGRFKILSMKNIHLKKSVPAPASPTSARQGHSLALPASVTGPASGVVPLKPVVLEKPGRSCSSCSIPTTTPKPPPPAPATNFVAPGLPDNVQPGGFGQTPNSLAGQPNYAQPQVPQNFPNGPADGQQYLNGPSPVQGSNPQGVSGDRTSKQYTGPAPQFNPNVSPQGFGPAPGGTQGFGPAQGEIQGFSPAQGGPQGFGPVSGGQPSPVKPTLVSAQMQIVDKNTDIHALRPGEKPGLPSGLNQNDMTDLLYTFNYTVGFHGHFEEGYRNGAKKGYYFVTGRNGVRTRIDYTADDTGFHPKISQEVLDLLSDDVPKPETEKDEKYGLKGYEFKWLYYPVDTNKQ